MELSGSTLQAAHPSHFSARNHFDFRSLQIPSSNSSTSTNGLNPLPQPNFPLRPAPPPPPVIVPDIPVQKSVIVSSNDRDTTVWPDPQHYRVTFQNPYRNVIKIELISAVLPNQASSGSVLDQPVLNIVIDEISHMDSTCTNIDKAFAVLPLKGASQTNGGFIVPELGAVFNMPREFKTPLASLNQLTISIVDLNGELFNFGADTPPPTLSLQNVLVFRITCLEKNQNVAWTTQTIH